MQLNDLEQVERLASKQNFSIFELPIGTDFSAIISDSLHITPQGTSDSISKEQIKEITTITSNKQSKPLFIIIERAEKMNEHAANAFLKALEEPGENVFYIFLTTNLGGILPTIKSRANIYYLHRNTKISDPPEIDKDIIALAKEYIGATPNQLPTIADKIIKSNKDNPRTRALEVINAGIVLMYKSYLIRGNNAFLTKIEQLMSAEEAIAGNGHVRLQLIANMI
jgi:DNA polymerase III delta prime subunit